MKAAICGLSAVATSKDTPDNLPDGIPEQGWKRDLHNRLKPEKGVAFCIPG
jgi:hypothetical protein